MRADIDANLDRSREVEGEDVLGIQVLAQLFRGFGATVSHALEATP